MAIEADAASSGASSSTFSKSDPTKPEAYLLSFHDTADSTKFDALTSWLNEKNCNITESINESSFKFIVATMSPEQGILNFL